jgi:Protein of unknown function (DUF3455)
MRRPAALFPVAFAAAFTVSQPLPAHADHVTPPPVPAGLQPAGNEAFLEGNATGTQDYICLPSGTSTAWTFFGPQATLFNKHDEQIITHFLSPNPFENGTPRVTWQDSEDTSKIWGLTIASVVVDRLRFPGCCSRWSEPKTGQPAATRCRRLLTSSG